MGKNVHGTALGLKKDPVFIVITTIMIVLLILFVVYPVFSVLVKSFRFKDEPSLVSYASFFKYSYYYRSMLNTLMLGVITTSIIVIISFALSYTVSKTELPFRGFLKIIAILPLISPPFIFSLALIIIAGRRGLIYQLLKISPSIPIICLGLLG